MHGPQHQQGMVKAIVSQDQDRPPGGAHNVSLEEGLANRAGSPFGLAVGHFAPPTGPLARGQKRAVGLLGGPPLKPDADRPRDVSKPTSRAQHEGTIRAPLMFDLRRSEETAPAVRARRSSGCKSHY